MASINRVATEQWFHLLSKVAIASNCAYIDHGAQFWHAIMKLAILLRTKNCMGTKDCTTKEGAIGILLLVASYVYKNRYFRIVLL